MSEIVVVLPAYNEEENLEELVEKWLQLEEKIKKEYGLGLRIMIVNDGSSDKTKRIGEVLERKYKIVTLMNHGVNKGLGEAVKAGIIHTLTNCFQCKYLCVMDCDNTHDPKFLLDMLKKQGETGVDVVIASRYQKGSEIKGLSAFRKKISEAARIVYSAVLNVDNVKDYTCGYRLYRTEILQKAYNRYGNHIIEEPGFTCMAELLYKLFTCNAAFAEVPFALRYDFKKGQSKMKIVKTLVNSLKLTWQLKKLKTEQ